MDMLKEFWDEVGKVFIVIILMMAGIISVVLVPINLIQAHYQS